MKIGIIREGKNPPDARVPLTPAQCVQIQKTLLDAKPKYKGLEIVVQPSPIRCFSDKEYADAGVKLNEDLNSCDILMGVKEVPVDQLIPDKTYLFFSHTIKEQPYNRKLLQEVLKKNIRLIDYETLTDRTGQRVIAFGRFAGIAGAHNGLMTFGERSGAYQLKQMIKFKDFQEAKDYYRTIKFPAFKVVLTGSGRVANGAAEVLDAAGIKRVSPKDFLNKTYKEAVYTQLDCDQYAAKNDGSAFDMDDFFNNPNDYHSTFKAYTEVADLMINGIYWDNRAPKFFTAEDMKAPGFKIKVIADITCDIAPNSSIPSTLFASTIADPVFGYDVNSGKAVEPYQENTVDVMSIDNLPNELPRDASKAFGEQFIVNVLDELLGLSNTGMIERATIAENGNLGKHYQYLKNYVEAEASA